MNVEVIIGGILLSAVVAVVSLPAVIRLAHRYDLLDHPGLHKRHKRPVPVLGGLGLFLSVWVPVGLAVLLLPGRFSDLAGSLLYIFLGAVLVFMVGFSDDLRPLTAWTKLVAQVAAGLILYVGGLSIDPITIPFYGSVHIGQLSVVITIAWVVGLTNAINIIDGLDGLASGVSLIGAVTLAVVGALYQVGSVLVFAYVLIGFLAVFLYFNRYPARIFLGDGGSLQIGFYFAVISLLVPVKSFTAAALYLPLLALAVPLMEAVVSIVRRLISGHNVMKADRRHLFHYLALAGLTPSQVVRVFWALSVVFGLFALAMFFWNRLLVFGLLVLFMVVISIIFLILLTDLSRQKRLGGRRARD